MWLEIEGHRVLPNATEDQLRAAIGALANKGPWSFVILSDEAGNYIQTAGGEDGCVVERRNLEPLYHMRAYREFAINDHSDGDKLEASPGPFEMKRDEWFRKEEVLDLFLSFYSNSAFPADVCWRSMN